MHWADFTAQRFKESGLNNLVSCSGITPSGEFHIGHLREILTAEMIHRSCIRLGLNSKYIFIVDSMDPLRRVYDFLSPKYEEYIGMPIAYIPAPDEQGEPGKGDISYADYFLEPFLHALSSIGVLPEVIMNHETYESGEFADEIDLVIKNKEGIKKIIEEISGRRLSNDWFPFNPLGSDGSMDGVIVTGYEYPRVSWIDRFGVEGFADIRKGEGKLPWRIDWAARWKIHGVTCEPAGKDHGAAGGSYDTGIPICELLGGKPPEKMVYEWIQMKGKGPMSSSSGLTIGPIEALEIIPPEIMRYTIARSKINRHIDFDTGETLIKIVDEYERIRDSISSEGVSNRMKKNKATSDGALRLSQIVPEIMPDSSTIPFSHLSLLAQIKSDNQDIWLSLKNSGHLIGEPSEWLVDRLWRMKNWINGPHFPEKFKISVNEVVSEEILEYINEKQKVFLLILNEKLKKCEWENLEIVDSIKDAIRESGINGGEGFTSIYLVILGKESGPRAASLILEIGRDHVCGLLSTMS